MQGSAKSLTPESIHYNINNFIKKVSFPVVLELVEHPPVVALAAVVGMVQHLEPVAEPAAA